MDKTDKTDPKTQNLDIDIDIEKEIDIDKEIARLDHFDREAYEFEYACYLSSGLSKEDAKRAAFGALDLS